MHKRLGIRREVGIGELVAIVLLLIQMVATWTRQAEYTERIKEFVAESKVNMAAVVVRLERLEVGQATLAAKVDAADANKEKK